VYEPDQLMLILRNSSVLCSKNPKNGVCCGRTPATHTIFGVFKGLFGVDEGDGCLEIAQLISHSGVSRGGAVHGGGMIGSDDAIVTGAVKDAQYAQDIRVTLVNKDLDIVGDFAAYIA
jgi:hypothetical protein